MENKIDKISDDISELRMLVAKQEFSISSINSTLDRLTESVIVHVKRSDAIQDLVGLLKEELSRLNSEHTLTKALLEAKIDAEKVSSQNMWDTLKTVLYTLSSVGAVLLALHELGVLDKLFK